MLSRALLPLIALVRGGRLELTGKNTAITFGDGASLSASCGSTPAVDWLDKPINCLEQPSIQVYFRSVPMCLGVGVTTPCFSFNPRYPPLFMCTLVGSAATLNGQPAHVNASSVMAPSGEHLGFEVSMKCDIPKREALTRATGLSTGDAGIANLTVEIYHAAADGTFTRSIPFAGLPGGNRLTCDLPQIEPPSTPPMLPPPSTPPPPPPACGAGGVYAAFETQTQQKCPLYYYDMETMESGKVKDLMGTGVNLKVHGSPQNGQPGKIGKTFSLNGCSSYFLSETSTPYAKRLDGNNPKTISAWAYLTGVNGNGDTHSPIVSFGDTPQVCNGESFGLLATKGTASGWRGIGCSMDLNSRVDPANDVNRWTHVVSTYDGGSNWRIYRDGKLIATRSDAHFRAGSAAQIAVGIETWHSGDSHAMCQGKVDEVKIYDYYLTPAQVIELYNLQG